MVFSSAIIISILHHHVTAVTTPGTATCLYGHCNSIQNFPVYWSAYSLPPPLQHSRRLEPPQSGGYMGTTFQEVHPIKEGPIYQYTRPVALPVNWSWRRLDHPPLYVDTPNCQQRTGNVVDVPPRKICIALAAVGVPMIHRARSTDHECMHDVFVCLLGKLSIFSTPQ